VGHQEIEQGSIGRRGVLETGFGGYPIEELQCGLRGGFEVEEG